MRPGANRSVRLRRGGTSDGDYLTPGVVRTVFGGAGADELRGAAGPDELYGMGGRDTIYGRGGDDVIIGAGANPFVPDPTSTGDRLYGGDGADRVRLTTKDRVRCGPGFDLAEPVTSTAPPVDCEIQRVDIADGMYGIRVPVLQNRELSVSFAKRSTTRSSSLLVRLGQRRIGKIPPQDSPFTARLRVSVRVARTIRRGRAISLCPVRGESSRSCAKARVRTDRRRKAM